MRKSEAGSDVSLCNLCVLCVSVVYFYEAFIHHGDTENAEVAQRRKFSLSIMTSKVQTTAPQQDTPAAPHLAKVLQRSCACGGSTGMTDSCSSCTSNQLAGTRVQAKLVVGPVNDPYEQEADRVADQVMRMPDSE